MTSENAAFCRRASLATLAGYGRMTAGKSNSELLAAVRAELKARRLKAEDQLMATIKAQESVEQAVRVKLWDRIPARIKALGERMQKRALAP